MRLAFSAALSRSRRAFRRAADWFPLTPLGLLVAAGSAFSLRYYAYEAQDLVLLVTGYAGAGIVTLGLLAVVATSFALKVRLRRGAGGDAQAEEEPLGFETGEPRPTGFSLPSLRFVPLVQISWGWETPRATVTQARDRGQLVEHASIPERGEHEEVHRRVVIADAFGLARMAVRQRYRCAFTVLPRAGALRRMRELTSFAGGDEIPHPMGIADGDRTELRRYVPGDPARFIHWKAYARTRRLVVRIPERALTRARRSVAYLVAGAGDDASAAAARVATETNTLGPEWTFGADGTPGVSAKNTLEARTLILRSVEAPAGGGAGLERFLADADREGPATTIVFAPPGVGTWVDLVVAAARRRPGRIRVVLGIDGLAREGARPLLRRLLSMAPPTGPGVARDVLQDTIAKLRAAGCDVTVLDRVSGKQLGPAHLSQRPRADAPRAAEAA